MMPAAMSEVQLLFFDTFAHDSGTDLNLDLVNFYQEVFISEVRIIPLGARVRADFPGGDRLGATNPSEFVLDFFVNDLSKPGASAFHKLGTLNYDQKGKIQLEFDSKTPTDGLVLRGWYSTVTLAVYGSLTPLREPVPPEPAAAPVREPSPPPSQPLLTPATPPPPPPPDPEPERVLEPALPMEVEAPPRSPPPDQRGTAPAPAPAPGPVPASPPLPVKGEEPLHPLSPGDVEAISDDDVLPEESAAVEPMAPASPASPSTPAAAAATATTAAAAAASSAAAAAAAAAVGQTPPSPAQQAARRTPTPPSSPLPPPPPVAVAAAAPAAVTAVARAPPAMLPEPDDLEDIESDEEPMDDVMDYADDEEWEEMLRPFNPDSFQLQSLQALRPPWLTQYELAVMGEVTSSHVERLSLLAAQWTEAGPDPEPSEVWVEEMEAIVPHLPAALGELRLRGSAEAAGSPRCLTCVPAPAAAETAALAWVQHGLDFDVALRHPQLPYKLRHLKVGVRLSAALWSCDAALAERLLETLPALLHLLDAQHMATSVRLMVASALSAAVRWRCGLQAFVTGENSGYQRVVSALTTTINARLKAAYISLVRKVHCHRCVTELCAAAGQLGTGELASEASSPDQPSLLLKAEACLTQVCELLRASDALLGHLERALPLRLALSAPLPAGQPRADLALLLRWSALPEALLVLMETPGCLTTPRLLAAARDLLNELTESCEGLHLLAAVPEVTGPLLRALATVAPLEDGGDEAHPLYQTGLWLVHCLQTLQLTDALQAAAGAETKQVSALHALCCLCGSARGRAALAHVLSRGDLLQPLIDTLAAAERGTAVAEAAADLILTVLRDSEHVPAAERLAERASSDPGLAERLGAARDWLLPQMETASRSDRVAALASLAREHADRPEAVPAPLVAALRLLSHAAVPPPACARQLRYRYALTQLYSADGLPLTLAVLRRLAEAYGAPAPLGPALLGRRGVALCALLRPTVALLRQMLALAVEARGTQFQDLTAVPPLVDTYLLLWSIPASATACPAAQRIQSDVVAALLTFTQPEAAVTSEASVQGSAWTRMVSGVLEAAVRSPATLMPSLALLSELLPLPLPLQTVRPLSETETAAALDSRRLWAAHLLTTGDQVRCLAALLCQTACAPLLQAARSLLVQLSDLSPPAALLVTSALLEAVHSTLNTPPGGLQHALNLLSGLVTQPCLKAAVLRLLADSQAALLARLLTLLTSRPAGVAAAELPPAREWLLSALHALCDQEVHMATEEGERTGALPPPPLLGQITDALMAHLSCGDAGFGSLLLAVRTLVILTEHSRGIHCIKSGLSRQPGCLQSLISRLSAEFSREQADCLATVQATLELLRLLSEPHSAAALSPPQLAAALRWCEQGEEAGELVDPPLRVLERKIQQEVCGEDEELDCLRDGFAEVIRQLDGVEEVPDSVEPGEPPSEEQEPASLEELYRRRPVWQLDADELPIYWLQQALDEDIDNEEELVGVSLSAVVRDFLPGVDLPAEVARLLRGADGVDAPPKTSLPTPLSGCRERGHLSLPARGRGFTRPPPRGDHFRSRAPNTSRPPSLHVDDFVALEKRGEHPTGPTGYNNVPRVPSRGRGGGRPRSRGRAAGAGFDRGGRGAGGFSDFRGARNRGGAGAVRGGGGGAAGDYRGSPARFRAEERFGTDRGAGGGGFRGRRGRGDGAAAGGPPYGGRFDKRDRFGFNGRERGGKHYRGGGFAR